MRYSACLEMLFRPETEIFADRIGLAKDFCPAVVAYWQRLQQRDGFLRAMKAEDVAGEQQKAVSQWW